MAVFSTILPVFMQSAAIRRIGSARSALIGTLGPVLIGTLGPVLIGTLGPVLTIFFGWWILGEPLSLAQMAGAGLVLAGVMLVSRR